VSLQISKIASNQKAAAAMSEITGTAQVPKAWRTSVPVIGAGFVSRAVRGEIVRLGPEELLFRVILGGSRLADRDRSCQSPGCGSAVSAWQPLSGQEADG